MDGHQTQRAATDDGGVSVELTRGDSAVRGGVSRSSKVHSSSDDGSVAEEERVLQSPRGGEIVHRLICQSSASLAVVFEEHIDIQRISL